MKLVILALLFFVLLPWQLIAPVTPEPVTTTEEKELGGEHPKPPAALPAAEEKEEPAATIQTKPIAVVNPLPQTVSTAPVEYNEAYVEELERAVHDRINAERVRANLSILKYNDTLANVAALHSTDMAVNNYFAHEDNQGCNSACRVTNSGYDWRAVGENLFLLKSTYRYSVEDASAIIVQGWMGSEGHRRNVLEPDFTYEGIGVVINDGAIYATEVFARPR